jgi:hypothetical protein
MLSSLRFNGDHEAVHNCGGICEHGDSSDNVFVFSIFFLYLFYEHTATYMTRWKMAL